MSPARPDAPARRKNIEFEPQNDFKPPSQTEIADYAKCVPPLSASPRHTADGRALERLCLCRYLGMDPTTEGGLLWIAEAALCAPLPKGWAEYTDAKGNVYFHKVSEGASTWEHPLDEHFRAMYRQEKENPSGSNGAPPGGHGPLSPGGGGGDDQRYLDGIRSAEARQWWKSMIGSRETKVGGLSDALSGWLEDKGLSRDESERLTNTAIEKMGRNSGGKVSFEEFNAFVEMHMSSAFTVDQMQSTVARIEIAMEAEQQERPQQARGPQDMGMAPAFHLDSDRSARSNEALGAAQGGFDRQELDQATAINEAEELRRREKDARKKKKKKEKKRRERERLRMEAENAQQLGGGGGGGNFPQQEASPVGPSGHAMDAMDGAGFQDEDDEYASPLNSGRDHHSGGGDGGLDGLYDEVFSGADTGGGGMGGGGGMDQGGFRPLSKKPPPARLPTMGGGGGLPGLPAMGGGGGLPGLGGGGGGGGARPDLAAFSADLPPKPALGGLGGLAPLGGGGMGGGGGELGGGLAPLGGLKSLGGLSTLPLPGRGGGPELDEFGAPKLPK